jgi:hypothetical protein
MTTLTTFIKKIKELDSPGFLKDKTNELQIEKECVIYLKSIGYKVSKNITNYKINNIDELIDFFYGLMSYYHNEVCSLVANREKDKALFSKFIHDRKAELGYTHRQGLQDCANVINALFCHEEALGLTIPVGTWVFGSDKCKWITDKAISILNLNQEVIDEFKVSQLVENDEQNSEEYLGFDFEHLRRLHGK